MMMTITINAQHKKKKGNSIHKVNPIIKIPMLKKKKKDNNDRKKREQHKNKTGASLGGLPFRLGLGLFLGELSRSDLEILGALTKGNSLKGLDKKSWLFGMRGLSITYELCSLLGCIRVQAFTRLSRPRRLAFPGWLRRSKLA